MRLVLYKLYHRHGRSACTVCSEWSCCRGLVAGMGYRTTVLRPHARSTHTHTHNTPTYSYSTPPRSNPTFFFCWKRYKCSQESFPPSCPAELHVARPCPICTLHHTACRVQRGELRGEESLCSIGVGLFEIKANKQHAF